MFLVAAKLGDSTRTHSQKLLLKYYAEEKTILTYIAYPALAFTFAYKRNRYGKTN